MTTDSQISYCICISKSGLSCEMVWAEQSVSRNCKNGLKYYCLLYIVCIGSDRPLLRDLHKHVVMEAAHKWRNLGMELLKYDPILDTIATDYSHDDVSCCSRVFKRWLFTSTDASWNQLIRALRSPTVQLHWLADQLEEMMNTECKIYSNTVATYCYKVQTMCYCHSSALIIIQQVQRYSKIPFVCMYH